jgi:hypothetical protein
VTQYAPLEEGGTVNINKGEGNWFARFGQIVEWLKKEDEYIRIDAKNKI